jgi:hypothetical protein
MKKSTVLKLWKVFGQLEGLKHDVRFSYFLAKNKRDIKAEIEMMEEAQKPSVAFMEYENNRVRLAQGMADKDVNGSPKIYNGQYIINDKKDDFEKEMKKLKTKFKKAVIDREQQVKEYNDMLDDNINLSLTKININRLPSQIEASVLEVFLEASLIDDDIPK